MKIFDVIDGMSNVRRWSHAYCHKEEFVIEHTAIVSLIALKIGMDIGADMHTLLQRALLHDMEEIITGDIPTPTKYANPKLTAEIHAYELESAEKVSQAFGTYALDSWIFAKDNTVEGNIITLADSAAVVYKIVRELRLGNNFFLQYVKNCGNALEKQKLDRDTDYRLIPYIIEFQDILLHGENYDYKNTSKLC